MKRVPLIVPGVAAASAAVYVSAALQKLCVYDREAIAQGEWWRLLTGHLVHFSSSHWWLGTLVFLAAGWLVERQSRRQAGALLAVSAISIGAALLLWAPQMRWYGGLSGVGTALLFFAALQMLSQGGAHRAVGIVVSAGILAKLGLEASGGAALFARFDSATVHPAPLSHAVGVIVAVGIYLLPGSLVRLFIFRRSVPKVR